MKTEILFLCLVALTYGEIVASNKHHNQHEQSVNAARQKLQESLSKLESDGYTQGTSYGNSYGSSGSQRYVSGCSSCDTYGGTGSRASYTSSRQSSSTSSRNSQGVDSNYNGVGIVGHTNDRYAATDNDDVQNVVVPSFSSGSLLSSRFSSQNAHEAEDMQQRVVPNDLSGIQSSAYRSGSSKYEEEEDQQSIVSPTVRPIYTGSVLRKQDDRYSEDSYSSSQTSAGSQNRGSSQVVNLQVRPGTSTVLAVPIRVINAPGIPENQLDFVARTSEHSSGSESSSNLRTQYPSSTTYRVVYTPSRSSVTANQLSSTYQSENSHSSGSVQQPEKLVNYNSYAPEASSSLSQSRFNNEERNSESSQVRVAPVSVNYPSNGGLSRVAYGSQSGHTQNRIVVAPVNTVETVSSSRTAEEREDRRYTPASPTYISSTRNSNSASDNQRNQIYSGSRPVYTTSDRYSSGSSQLSSNQQGSSGTTYYSPSRTQYQTQSQHQSGSSGTQSQRQGGYVSPNTGSRISNSQSSDFLSQRFGSGISSLNTDDLQAYMSESERLAKLQQEQIHRSSSSGSSLSASEANRHTLLKASNLDSAAANFIQNSQVGSRLGEFDQTGAGSGGYNRVMSWNKQSKWSSGSEYGSDGKPKTYSTLSTAEAENHKVNGKEAGYKAATTTLENDGKVSTYSIHT